MIFNPVRYVSGGATVKQVNVKITTTVGGFTNYYMQGGVVKMKQAANISADAGSMLVLIARTTTTIGTSLTGATEKLSTTINQRDIIFAQVDA